MLLAEDDAATTRLWSELGGHGRAKRVEDPLRPGEIHPARQVAMFRGEVVVRTVAEDHRPGRRIDTGFVVRVAQDIEKARFEQSAPSSLTELLTQRRTS